MNKVYIGIGSNLGDREALCSWAVRALNNHPGLFLRQVSSIYLTEPVGFVSAHWFYNLVVELETSLSPWELWLFLRNLEQEAGRVRAETLIDRTLDLDLLLYADLVLDSPLLTLPHPRLHQRRFVLAPLTEINPWGEHPIIKESFASLLARLPTKPEVRRLAVLKW